MSDVGSHLGLLLGTRWRAVSNRVRSAGALPKIAAGLLLAAGVLLVLGHLAAPALLAAPREAATGGGFGPSDRLPAGTTALEATFWLTVLAATVTSFRVMEILYRRADVRAVETYPVALPALFVDRTLAALLEAFIVAGFATLFFVPLAWHGRPDVLGLCALTTTTGMTASALVSLTVQVYAGDMNARASAASAKGSSSGVYGGPGQLFMFSPAIALAGSAIVILLARLSVGELLGAGAQPRGFWVGWGAIWVATLIGLVGAFRRFIGNFPRMAARFREADVVHYEAHLDYQTSAYADGGRLEGLLPADARPHYRTLALQYARGNSLVRYSYVIVWIVAGVALTQWSRSAFPPWAVGLVPAAIAATMANPWYRIVQPPLRPRWADLLPVEPADEARAGLLIAAREVLIIALPYAAIVLLADASAAPTTAGLEAALALLGGLALNGTIALARTTLGTSTTQAFLIPAAVCVVLVVVAIASLAAAVGLALLLAGLQFAPLLMEDADKSPDTTASAGR